MRLSLAPAAAVAPLLFGLCASPTQAQQWARKMFNKLDHDFGAVARGADTVYKFEVTNIYKEDIRLSGVRTSCRCTTPEIKVPQSASGTLKTYEKGYIVATFNTRAFTGLHSATLTVSIDQPFPAQVQLRVHGNIRGDVVFEPGSIDFGRVDQGASPEKSVAVRYAGLRSWRITDVRSASNSLEVELAERARAGGRADYNLLIRLKPTAPPGLLNEQLVLVTSDQNNPRIPLDVQGRVVPEIAVAPEKLVFGQTPLGEKASRRIIVRGKQPFRITKVTSVVPGFDFRVADGKRERHIVRVDYTPVSGSGPMQAPIIIETDMGVSYAANCTAYATLVPAPPSGQATGAASTTAPETVVQGQ